MEGGAMEGCYITVWVKDMPYVSSLGLPALACSSCSFAAGALHTMKIQFHAAVMGLSSTG